jgi:hypothetical protein
LLNFTT